jgi:fucose permease
MTKWDRRLSPDSETLGVTTTSSDVCTSLRRAEVGLYLAFTGLGATGAVVPAALPGLAEKLSVPSASLLPAVAALFAGLFVGVSLTPLVAQTVGASRGVALGAFLQGGSLLSLGVAGTTTGVVAAALFSGVGFGLVEASGAGLVRQLHDSTSRTLTGLTATTAAAAALTPLVVLAAGARVHYVLIAVAVPHAVAVLALHRRGRSPRPTRSRTTSGVRPSASVAWCAAVFCYVGCETVVVGWSSVVPQSVFQLSSPRAAIGTSAFWTLLMVGRFIALLALQRGAPGRGVLAACQGSASVLLTCGALVAGQRPQLSLLMVGLAVCCMGPCYALLLAAAIDDATEQDAARAARRLVAVGALGGALFAGAVASAGSVGAATVASAAATGMAVSLLLAQVGTRRRANPGRRTTACAGNTWEGSDQR